MLGSVFAKSTDNSLKRNKVGQYYELGKDIVLYDVVPVVTGNKKYVLIQLFWAHTSEPFGELQVPHAHVPVLIEKLQEFLPVEKGDESERGEKK